MKISTKGRYGLKAMVDLAANTDQGYISLKSIAERQEISETYLEQLFSALKKAGLVKSVRGAQGGYILAKPASETSVREVLTALEGSLSPIDCDRSEDTGDCPKQCDCSTRSVWEKLRHGIYEAVESISLQDLVDDMHKRKDQGQGWSLNI